MHRVAAVFAAAALAAPGAAGQQTISGCTCKATWTTTSCPGKGPFHGCPPTPCDGDNGGVSGDSWCTVVPGCATAKGGGKYDYCAPAKPTPAPPTGPLGLTNNWVVAISGLMDGAGCLRASSIKDVGADTPVAANGNVTCVDPNICGASGGRPKPPASFGGCTFDTTTARNATLTGYVLDNLCYDNFIVKQEDSNGAAGASPDHVYVRTSMPQHTLACLTVSYCAATGYVLLRNTSPVGATPHYKLLARLEAGGGGAGVVFEFLSSARSA